VYLKIKYPPKPGQRGVDSVSPFRTTYEQSESTRDYNVHSSFASGRSYQNLLVIFIKEKYCRHFSDLNYHNFTDYE